MAIKKVHVVERDGEFQVSPSIIELSKGNDTMKIVNHTPQDLFWVVSDPLAFSVEVGEIVKKKGGAAHAGKAVPATATLGAYDYQIVMLKSGKKAKGNSDPMVIIDT